jgi:thiol-disulfide isomerase/thioredoxin
MKPLLKVSLSIIISLGWLSSFAQDGHRIVVTIKGLRDSTCYLAHAYENLYSIQDTAKADANGTMVFTGKKKLPGGLYTLAIGKAGAFEFLMSDDQDFEVTTDTTGSYRANLTFKGTLDNEIFSDFQRKWTELAIKKQAAKEPAQKQDVEKQQEDLQKNFIKTNEGTFASKILKANMPIDFPPLPAKPTRKDTLAQAAFFWNHFWDNIDLKDDKMLRVPFLKPRLDYFLENIAYFGHDSVNKVLDNLMTKTTKGTDLRKYIAMRCTYAYEVPKAFILGNDTDVNFIHMAERYYIGEPELWDTATVRKVKERVDALKPLLLGKKLQNMMLADTLTRSTPLYSVAAKYTVVYFYSPDCHHCKEATPKLAKGYQNLKAKGIDAKVYAVEIDRNKDKWKKFIREYKTQSLINVTDHYTMTDFKNWFDIRSTPTVYVLDREKKIIAKKIASEQIEDLIMALEKQDAAQKKTTPAAGK